MTNPEPADHFQGGRAPEDGRLGALARADAVTRGVLRCAAGDACPTDDPLEDPAGARRRMWPSTMPQAYGRKCS